METQRVPGPATVVRPLGRPAAPRPGAGAQLPSRPPRVHLVGASAQAPALAAALRAAAQAVELVGPADPATADGADAVLVVCDAGQELTGAELDRLRALPLDRPVLLALVKVDLYPSWRDVLDANVGRMRALGVVAEPFPLPSLPTWLADGRTLPAVAALAERILAVAPLDEPPLHESSEPDRPTPDGAAEPPVDRPTPRRTGARRRPRPARDRRSWSHVLGDGCAAAASDVDFDLRTRVRAVLAEAEQAIEAGDPAENWAGFDTWLRTRLTFEAGRTCALLQDRLTAVATALTAHLELPERQALRPPSLPPLPELFEHLPDRGDPTGARRPFATRGRTLLVSAYGGIMMTLLVPRLAGLQLSGWVVAAVAVVAAVTLAGATLAGERKRQLDRRRSHAKTLVRHCTDSFLLSAGKFTKDSLRAGQQALRDACAERDDAGPRG